MYRCIPEKKAGERDEKDRMLYTYTQVYIHTYTYTYICLHIYSIYRLRWTAQQMNGSAFPAVSFTVFTVCACCGSPGRPSRFSFRNRFRFHAMRILLTHVCVCVCVCVCVLSYYYTHCMVKKIKRENRPLIASAHTRFIAHKYFVSKPSSVYIYYVRLAYIIIYRTQVRHAHCRQTLL